MLTNMRMRNFKSWRDTGDVRLAPLTCFFGTNSSGKSSLLQMLLLLKQTAESRDRGLVLRTNPEKDGYVNLGTIPELIHNGGNRVEFDLDWTLPAPIDVPASGGSNEQRIDRLAFHTSIYADKSENYVERMSYRSDGVDAEMVRKDDKYYDVKLLINGAQPLKQQARPYKNISPPIKCYGFSDEALRLYQDGSFLNDIVLAFENLFQRIFYLGPLREYPRRSYPWAGERPAGVGLKGEEAIAALLAKKKEPVYPRRRKKALETRIAEWLVELGMASSFRTESITQGGVQYEVRLKRTAHSPEVLVTDLGFGVSQVLPVLVLCYYAPVGSTIILEQPEIHLHPFVQSGLADVFIDIIKRRDIQLIIESHSEHLLRRLQRRIAEEEIQAKDTALYFCRLANGTSHIEQLEVDVFGNITNWPQDFFGDMTGDMLEMTKAGIERQVAVARRDGKDNAASVQNGTTDH